MAGQRSGFFRRSSHFTISDGAFNDASGDINQYYSPHPVAGPNYGPTFILNYPTPQGPTSPLESSNSRHGPTRMDGTEWMPGGGYGSQQYVGRGSSTHSISGSQDSLANLDPVRQGAGRPYNEEASFGVSRRVPSDGGRSNSQYSGVRYDSHRSESSRRSRDRAHSDISASQPDRRGTDHGYNDQAPRPSFGSSSPSHSGWESHSSASSVRRSHSRHRSSHSQESDLRHTTHRFESSRRSSSDRQHSDKFEPEASMDYRGYDAQPPRRDSGASHSTSCRECYTHSSRHGSHSRHSSHSRHRSCTACSSRSQYRHDSPDAYGQSSALSYTQRSDEYYELSTVDEDAGRRGVQVWNFPAATVWSIPRGHVVVFP
ncbi:hypothetical protein B0H16DRAFT_662052 [Mycena metata]|uniref:Uncharacterized protein n=1 Tax=Mycena metata TaxID=1033252 RepID=A0AAD7GZP8_9AGAR|nr:hypothetical protein B0H16DRAFT_662052 [Mycena metata]